MMGHASMDPIQQRRKHGVQCFCYDEPLLNNVSSILQARPENYK